MKHYLDLVPISAKVHRKQNRMSIFCIILAVFLITTIFGMADMFIRSQIIQAKIDNGDFHITVQGITDEEAGLIKKRPDVKAAARYGVLNFNDDKGYTISDKKSIIVGADEEFVTQLQMGVINEGNFPQNDNEAMITKNAGENLGLQIGDTVTIKRPGEPELSYQISGFCNNTSKIMSEDAYGVFLTTSAFREIGDISDSTVLADHNMVLFVQFTKTYNIQNTINRLKEDCNLSAEQISENTKLLGLLGQSSNSFMMQVYISAFVLFVLVLTAGITIDGKHFPTDRIAILKEVGSFIESPSFYANLTGKENLDIIRRILGLPQSTVDDALELVGLSEFGNRLAKKYSLGMKQRLGLAGALLGRPPILILDEPTNGLDPSGIHEIRNLIKSLPDLYDCTVLISSHMLSEIELIADDIGILNHGRLLFEGSLDDLRQHALQSGFATDNLEDMFLSMVEKDNASRKQRAKL